MLNDDIQLEKKGLDIAYRYYWKIGRPVLEELFPDYMDQIAVGLVGEGSECFGYDDKISTDHDYGASFCIWLPREAYNKIGDEMNGIYDALPKEIGGVTSKIQRVESQGRRGVLEIEAFYQKFLGKNGIPKTLSEWMVIPEHYLAVATNGRVFEDNLGMFSKIRETLLAYYPEDVRLKKIAARAIMMAHSGQCNYARMMRRGDTVAAHFALDEFMSATVSMAYLLNKKYAPYYKWMWRGMENLEKLTKVRELLEEISRIRLDTTLWCTNRWDTYQYSLNTNDRIVVLIEEICALVIEEMKNQEISSSTSDYLEEHAYAARHRIRNEEIRSLPILAS
jgi:hypothetical protein